MNATITNDAVDTSAPNFAAFDATARYSNVRKYDASEVAAEGYYNVVIRYRETDKKKIVPDTKVVTVPRLEIPALFIETGTLVEQTSYTPASDALTAIFSDSLYAGLEAIVKYAVDGENKKTISWDDVTLAKVTEYLTTARTSMRLTREAVEAWVAVALKVAITARAQEISERKGLAPALAAQQLATTMKQYQTVIGSLSAAVPKLAQEDAEAADKMLKRANVDDDISRALLKKLDTVLRPVVAAGDL